MTHVFGGRARHRGTSATVPPEVVIDEAERRELSTAFAPSRWLQDVGRTSWLLVGLFALLAGLVWLLGTTSTIVGPVVAATVVAAIATPLVSGLERRRIPRAAGAALILLGLLAIGLLVLVIVIGGITSQHEAISRYAAHGADRAAGWLQSVGVSERGASGASKSVSAAAPSIVSALGKGIVHGITGIASLMFALSLAWLSLFFLLKDGPSLRSWVDGHLGVPRPVATTITGGIIRSLRGYFRGVTVVAAFNGVVVGLGALALGVPLAGTIAVVSFVTAYVPFIGALVAGVFTVVVALGAKGVTTALIMLVIVLLGNGLFQNLVQPFAMGSALDLHPLVVLIVTIAAGCVFGTLGLILAAPLTSAAVRIDRELSRAVQQADARKTESGQPATLPPT